MTKSTIRSFYIACCLALCLAIFGQAFGQSKPAAAMPGVKLNVRDFGATGDGKTKDTPAIQQAIDRGYVMGGGDVLLRRATI